MSFYVNRLLFRNRPDKPFIRVDNDQGTKPVFSFMFGICLIVNRIPQPVGIKGLQRTYLIEVDQLRHLRAGLVTINHFPRTGLAAYIPVRRPARKGAVPEGINPFFGSPPTSTQKSVIVIRSL